MNEVDQLRRSAARSWVQKAEDDLVVAVHTLKLGRRCPTAVVCFHAQQSIEKYQKAWLVNGLVDFPKTHDLNALARLAPGPLRTLLDDVECRRLTQYATVMRYPGDYQPIPLAEARQAVRLARRVRSAIRKLLPRSALPRGPASRTERRRNRSSNRPEPR